MAETPRHVRATHREPMGVGSYTRTLETPNDQFTDTLDENDPANWPPEKIRAAGDYFARANEKLNTRTTNANAFLARHPEFVDTDRSGRTLHALFGDEAFTDEQYEIAYNACRANNAVDIDQGEIVKQKQAEANQRAKAERARRAAETRVYTEDEKYNMSLQELRQVEDQEIKRQFELEGQRGGNGW